MTSIRRRHWPETLMILGLCLMAVTAVSWADAPEASQAQVAPTPTPAEIAGAPLLPATPTPEPPAPTPEPTLPAIPEVPTAVPTETATPVPAVATPVPTATPAATANATPTPVPTAAPERFSSVRAARQAPAPTPTPVPTAVPEFTAATLTACRYDEATGRFESVVLSSDDVDNPIYFEDTAIVPAPPSGCENVEDRDDALAEPIRVCHATGNPERPYELTPPRREGQTDGHELHRGDIIPAPRNTCPGLGDYGVPTPTPTAQPDRTPHPTPTATPDRDDSGEQDVHGGGLEPLGEALDDLAAGVDPTTTAGVDETAVEAGALFGEQLPFTGPEHVGALVALGLGLVLTGAGLRRLG